MRKEGPEPNEVTYSHVLGACARGGQIRVAFSLLDEVRRCRVQPVTAAAAVGPSLYCPLLRACADAGNHARTKSIVDMMREDSLEITTKIMNLYLLSLARNGLHDRALLVLGSMMTIDDDDAPSRRRPDVVLCNTVLVKWLGSIGRVMTGDEHMVTALEERRAEAGPPLFSLGGV
jgi:pentatricopeptide repeat protein